MGIGVGTLVAGLFGMNVSETLDAYEVVADPCPTA